MNQVTDPNIRARRITRTSYVGISANILLAGFKAAVGLLSNSVAIVLDAVNNLTDALSSVLTILGVKLASRRPDAKHPFGYGRIEYFSAVTIAALILAAGAGSSAQVRLGRAAHPRRAPAGRCLAARSAENSRREILLVIYRSVIYNLVHLIPSRSKPWKHSSTAAPACELHFVARSSASGSDGATDRFAGPTGARIPCERFPLSSRRRFV